MSLISLNYQDSSDSIARDCAAIVVEKMTETAAAAARPEKSSLAMSLENLYRLLEMFKYHSYEDEPRRGVLMMEQDELAIRDRGISNQHWQDRITSALESAVLAIYPDLDRTTAIEKLQGSLRAVAKNEDLGAEVQKHKEFFAKFRDSI